MNKTRLLFVLIFTFLALPGSASIAAWSDTDSNWRQEWYVQSTTLLTPMLQKILTNPKLQGMDAFTQSSGDVYINNFAVRRQAGESREAFLERAGQECAKKGLAFQTILEVGTALSTLDLAAFSNVYGHDLLGNPITYSHSARNRPIGILFMPNEYQDSHWYYALDGREPPETAPFGVFPLGGGWYMLAP